MAYIERSVSLVKYLVERIAVDSVLFRKRIDNCGEEETRITPSKEDYLRALYERSAQDMVIRSIDIAGDLRVSRASVSRMLNILKDEGYINKEKYGSVTLTEKGCEVAKSVKERYDLLKDFFQNIIGVESSTAAKDACRIEYVISQETMNGIIRKLQKNTVLSKKLQ